MTAAQLDLFAPAVPVIDAHTLWMTGPTPWTLQAQDLCFDGAEAYVHLIRHPHDPERMSREEAKRLGVREVAPHKRLDEIAVSEWRRLIRKHIHDRGASTGHPSADRAKDIRHEHTFNRLMVEIADVTADIAFGTNADRALWSLVHAGILEHTMEAPILFRLVNPSEIIEDVFSYLDGDGAWRCSECGGLVPLNRWTREPEACTVCDPTAYELDATD